MLLIASSSFAASPETWRAAVEHTLLSPVIVEGHPGMTLAERMRFYDVPGLSIAVWSDGKIDWARGYGVVARSAEPLKYQWFQGPSGDTSKPVGTDSATFTSSPLTTEMQFRCASATAAAPPMQRR